MLYSLQSSLFVLLLKLLIEHVINSLVHKMLHNALTLKKISDKLTGDIRPESDVGWVPIWKYFNFRFGGVNTEVTVQLRAWPLLLILNKRFSSNIRILQAKNWKINGL